MVLTEFFGQNISLCTETQSLCRDFFKEISVEISAKGFKGDFLKKILIKVMFLCILRRKLVFFSTKTSPKYYLKGLTAIFTDGKFFPSLESFFHRYFRLNIL